MHNRPHKLTILTSLITVGLGVGGCNLSFDSDGLEVDQSEGGGGGGDGHGGGGQGQGGGGQGQGGADPGGGMGGGTGGGTGGGMGGGGATGSSGFTRGGNFWITGRIDMGDYDRLQCGIVYTGAEVVGSPPRMIAGLDSVNFGTEENGKPTDKCGKIARATINGKQVDFVIADRIHQNTSSSRNSNQLDVAKKAFDAPDIVGGQNIDDAPVVLTGEVASGLTCCDWVSQDKYYNDFCSSYGSGQGCQ
jgi:hypothetical protein